VSLVNVYITCPDEVSAQKIAEALLAEQLIACANYWAIQSIYTWNGETQQGQEYALLLKTTQGCLSMVQQVVKALHPYDIPCIEHYPVQAVRDYADWVQNAVLQ
jgi:periplasmic divalent cation tolerance protein